MVDEKVEELLFLIWNISKTIRNSRSRTAYLIPGFFISLIINQFMTYFMKIWSSYSASSVEFPIIIQTLENCHLIQIIIWFLFLCLMILWIYIFTQPPFSKFTAVLSNILVKGSDKHVISVLSVVSVWELNPLFSALSSKFMLVKKVAFRTIFLNLIFSLLIKLRYLVQNFWYNNYQPVWF